MDQARVLGPVTSFIGHQCGCECHQFLTRADLFQDFNPGEGPWVTWLVKRRKIGKELSDSVTQEHWLVVRSC